MGSQSFRDPASRIVRPNSVLFSLRTYSFHRIAVCFLNLINAISFTAFPVPPYWRLVDFSSVSASTSASFFASASNSASENAEVFADTGDRHL